MILHIVEEEKFLNKAIIIFEEIYPGKNVFLVGIKSSNEKFKYLKKGNRPYVHYSIIGTQDYKEHFGRFVKDTTLVFFHNLYKEYKLRLFQYIPIDRKIAWFFWGAELYGLYQGKRINNFLPLTKKIYYSSLPISVYIRKRVLSRLKRIYYWYKFKKVLQERVHFMLTNITEDLDLLQEFISTTAQKGWFTYFSFDFDSKTLGKKSESKENILIGNSSSPENNHFDTLEMLKKKNIKARKIIVPLNYGDPFYRNLVVKQAEKSFGRQFLPIVDYMELDDYSDLINSCSVLIMNHKRQQAFNTIMLALSNGCKVFLRKENTIYSLLKRNGFVVFSIQNDMERQEALNALSDKDQNHNLSLIRKIYSKQAVLKRIKNEFEYMLNEPS